MLLGLATYMDCLSDVGLLKGTGSLYENIMSLYVQVTVRGTRLLDDIRINMIVQNQT